MQTMQAGGASTLIACPACLPPALLNVVIPIVCTRRGYTARISLTVARQVSPTSQIGLSWIPHIKSSGSLRQEGVALSLC